MLTPNNAVDYSNPAAFKCGDTQLQAAFMAHHKITEADFVAITTWFNGNATLPAPYIVSGVDMDNLIAGADCKTVAVIVTGDISLLGHTDMNVSLMTYTDLNNNRPEDFIGAYGIDLFEGLKVEKEADAFHFYKGTYNYSTNPEQKLESAIFIAYANGQPVYYADFSSL